MRISIMNRNSLLTNNEGMPEWSNGADSRSVSLCLRRFESSFPHGVGLNLGFSKECLYNTQSISIKSYLRIWSKILEISEKLPPGFFGWQNKFILDKTQKSPPKSLLRIYVYKDLFSLCPLLAIIIILDKRSRQDSNLQPIP